MAEKTIRIEAKDLPRGKVNLRRLSSNLGTDRISYCPQGGSSRKVVTDPEGGTSVAEEAFDPFMEVTFDDASITAAQVVSAVKSHAPELSGEEESAQTRETLEIDDIVKKLKKSAFMKKVLTRLKALDGKDE